MTRKLIVTGGGYTFTGGISAGSTYAGTYTGPGVTGGFAGSKASATTVSKGYCGTLSGHDNAGAITATFNLVIAGGSFSGFAANDEGGVRLTGTVTGTSLTGYGVESGGGSATITGTVSGNSLTGNFSGSDTTGTFTASSCGTF